MPDERQSSKLTKIAAAIIASVYTLSLFALCWLLAREGLKGASDKMTLARWLYLAGAVITLFLAIVSAFAIYTTWFSKAKATGALERRGGHFYCEVRDDNFERQLDWLRRHKRLVKAIEGIVTVILGLLAILYIINEP